MPHSILLVDDQIIFRAGLRGLIDAESDLFVAGEAVDASSTIGQPLSPSPDLVLLAVDQRDDHATKAVRGLKTAYVNTKILALSSHGEPSLIEEVLRAGATGFLLKGCDPDELLDAIRSVVRGEIVVSTTLQDVVLSQYRRLLTGDVADGAIGQVEMAASDGNPRHLISTKLHRPRVSSLVIPRQQLWAQLDRNVDLPLTLISAPAGYGKSTLVVQWLAARAHRVAWISLDERDNDLQVFLTYWIEAVQRLFPDSLPKSTSLLEAIQLPPAHVLTKTLVNEMAQIKGDFVLVLDDYQQIDTPAIHTLLQDILRHPPAPLHLILTTRVDPPFNLLKMRAQQRIGEIRAQTLRFSVDETAAFLEKALDISPDNAVVAALADRTEGWVTGMHLIALAVQTPAELTGIPTVLPGEHQTLDYLVSEALVRQPQALQAYLLKIAILNRFNASLCDAICIPSGDDEQPEITGEYFVRWLVERNLFVVSLDPFGSWFRYHRLFQDLLQNQLANRFPAAQIADLHAKACAWYLAHDMADDAFDHAMQAGDLETVFEIVETYRYAELDNDRCHIVERWLGCIPPEVVTQHLGLILAKAWTESHRHRMDRIPPLIAQADALLADEAIEPVLLADLNYLRGNLQYWTGEGEESVRSLEAASVQIEGPQRQIEYNAELMLAMARCMIGKKEAAILRLNRHIRVADTIEGQYKTHLMGGVAIIHMINGDLSQTYVQAERLHVEAATRQSVNNDAWSAYLRGCAALHAFKLEKASNHFSTTLEHRYSMHRGAAVDASAGLVVAQQLLGNEVEASDALDGLLEFAHGTDDVIDMAVAQSCRARVCLMRGDVASAMQWVQTVGEMKASPVPFLWLEVPAITFCRVLIASGVSVHLAQAIRRLREMRQLYESGHFTGQIIEVAVLQALAMTRQERVNEALSAAVDALTVAMPGGWLRPFVEAGPSMIELLHRVSNEDGSGELNEFIDAILSVQPAQAKHGQAPGLLEPLTEREVEIVRLLATELSTKEIAEQLVVSIATVRAHTRNVYSKMDVHGRYEAVQRAKDLGLI